MVSEQRLLRWEPARVISLMTCPPAFLAGCAATDVFGCAIATVPAALERSDRAAWWLATAMRDRPAAA